MSEEFGPDFITVTDEDGNDLELEFLDALEFQGTQYMAFFPAEMAGDDGQPEDDEDGGLIILKVIEENGDSLLSTLETDEEMDAVYQQFMEILFSEDEEEGE